MPLFGPPSGKCFVSSSLRCHDNTTILSTEYRKKGRASGKIVAYATTIRRNSLRIIEKKVIKNVGLCCTVPPAWRTIALCYKCSVMIHACQYPKCLRCKGLRLPGLGYGSRKTS